MAAAQLSPFSFGSRSTAGLILSGLLLAMMMVVIATSTGCAGQAGRDATAKMAVQYATLKVIENADDPLERRDRIVRLAELAIAAADGENVVVAELEARVRAAVPWQDLSPADTLLADYLITLTAAELESRTAGGPLMGETLVSAKVVLEWIVQVARIS